MMAKESEVMETVNVAVAFVRNGGRVLLEWNHEWGAFGFPMTKIREWETTEFAAMRAAATVLGVPLELTPDFKPVTFEVVLTSQRTGKKSRKVYTLVNMFPSNNYIDLIAGSAPNRIWMAPTDIFEGKAGPLASSMPYFLEPLMTTVGWIPVTHMPVSTPQFDILDCWDLREELK